MFLKFEDLGVFLKKLFGMPPILNIFFISVPLISIPPLPKKSKSIGLQLWLNRPNKTLRTKINYWKKHSMSIVFYKYVNNVDSTIFNSHALVN